MNKIIKLQESQIFKPLGHKVESLNGVRYKELVEVLGQPTYDYPSGDDKVQKEWVVKFGDKQFTIYDWKTYDAGYTMNELDVWSVGGTENPLAFKYALLQKLGRI